MTKASVLPLALLLTFACASGSPTPPRSEPTGVAGARTSAPWQDPESAPSAPAMRFVSQAGASVAVTGLQIETVVSDPIAWTELTITLANRGPARAEGRLEIALPGSTFVARESAADGTKGSALDERSAPSGRGERVFRSESLTLDPGQSRSIHVQHAAALSGPSRTFELRLSGIGQVSKTKLRVQDRSQQAPLVDESFENREPPDLMVQSLAAGTSEGGGFAFQRAQAPAAAAAAAPATLVFLIDTSATRARDLGAELRLLHSLADALPDSSKLVVAAYDEAVAPLYEGRGRQLPARLPNDLAERGTLGSSNALVALEWAFDKLGEDEGQIVIVSDGIDRGAASDPAELGAALRARMKGARPRIDVLAPSGAQNSAVQRMLASQVAPRRGRVLSVYDAGAPKALLAEDAAAPAPAGLLAAWPSNPDLAAPGADVVVLVKASGAVSPGAPAVPAWVTASLAREAPRHERALGRYAAIERSARPFLPASYDKEELDPLSTLKEKPPAAAEPAPSITMSSKPAPKAAPSATEPAISDVPAALPEKGSLPPDTVLGIIRRNFGRFRGCYQETLRRVPGTAGKIVIRFEILPSGVVSQARSIASDITSPELLACVVRSFEALSFPGSDRDPITVTYPLVLAKGDGTQSAEPKALQVAMRGPVPPPLPGRSGPTLTLSAPPKEPWSGDAKVVYEAIGRGAISTETHEARRMVRERPEDTSAYLLLGDALLAEGDKGGATRAYLSLLELAPDDVSAQRLTAGRLMSAGGEDARAKAEAALKRAIELAPEQPSSLHMLASLRAQRGDLEAALRLLDVALERTSDPARYPGVRELLRFDLGVVGAALATKEPARKIGLARWVADVGAELETKPAFRVALTWEGGESDLDLKVRDRGLSSTAKTTPVLASGGKLAGDVKQGRGPEGFLLSAAVASRSYPYALAIALNSARGERVAGSANILELDAQGRLAFETRPFVIDVVGGEGSLGTLDAPLAR